MHTFRMFVYVVVCCGVAMGLGMSGCSNSGGGDGTDSDNIDAQWIIDHYGAEAAAARAYLHGLGLMPEPRVVSFCGDRSMPIGETAQQRAVAYPRLVSAGSLALLVGKNVFQGALRGGGRLIFNEIIGAFGFGSGGVEQALSDIEESLEALHQKVDAMLITLEKMMDKDTCLAFEASQQEVATRASLISGHLNTYKMWVDQGHTPLEETVRAVALSTYVALAELQGALMDPAGGSVTKLLAAASVDQTVSNLNTFWVDVIEYLGIYSAINAQALMVLSALAPLDSSGDTEMWLLTGSEVAMDTVEGMHWAMGTPIFQKESGPQYVHVRNEDWILADGSRPNFHGESWSGLVNRNGIEEHLTKIRDTLRPESHGVSHLEGFLEQQGIRRIYPLLDTYTVAFRDYNYVAVHTNLEVKENSLTFPEVEDGKRYTMMDADAPTKAQWEMWAAYSRQQSKAAPMKVMDVETNWGKRAARFDEKAILDAMMGVAGFDVDQVAEGVLQITIEDPFSQYALLRFVDAATGDTFVEFGRNDTLEAFTVPDDGGEHLLVLVEQGYRTSGQFNTWAQSAFGTAGEGETLIQISTTLRSK